jgi:PLP dependent protein
VAKRSPLGEKLAQVRDRIAAAAAKARRDPADILLVAVTKNAAPEQIREILSLGVGDLGESRVQVLIQRGAQVNEFFQRRQAHGDGAAPSKLRWHMIGHLQRNKVKAMLPLIGLVHSVDSLRLAEEIDIQAERIDKKIPVLMQVNTSEEQTKFGVSVGAAVHLGEQIDSMPHLQLMGLMAMAPPGAPEKQLRHCFARTREVFEEMQWHKIGAGNFRHLSMGMSDDFESAILEGATLLRIGSALFGGKTADHLEPEEA